MLLNSKCQNIWKSCFSLQARWKFKSRKYSRRVHNIVTYQKSTHNEVISKYCVSMVFNDITLSLWRSSLYFLNMARVQSFLERIHCNQVSLVHHYFYTCLACWLLVVLLYILWFEKTQWGRNGWFLSCLMWILNVKYCSCIKLQRPTSQTLLENACLSCKIIIIKRR